MSLNVFFCLILVIIPIDFIYSTPVSCESPEEECKKGCHPVVEDKINVHLIAHSHDDVGWLQTYQGYYDGNPGFTASVHKIIDSTVKQLDINPNRRFIQVETAFLYKWWANATDEMRCKMKNLINEGRLEIINGGWTMNDEAAAHYQSIIDQFTLGFGFLEETLGVCARPTIGWQIDPFGHSREHAHITKQLGFDGLILGRIDYRDKEKRIKEKNLDFFWNTNDNFNDSLIFTSMFPDFYVYPDGFCLDSYCGSSIESHNVNEKVASLKKILDNYKEYYRTNNILLPMGHDFSYSEAERNFHSIDNLIEGFKNDDKYNVIYSTPSCYISSVKNEITKNKIELTIKNDDFFPYAFGLHAYWTGYFTSRPTSKRFERLSNNLLQSSKQLTTISKINSHNYEQCLTNLKNAMGVMQHHDAITGTEKQFVTEDYHSMLYEGIIDVEKANSLIINNLLGKIEPPLDLTFSYCLFSNVSVCQTSQNNRFLVAVQNPLSKVVSHYIRIPVNGENYKITGPNGTELAIDIFDSITDFTSITSDKPSTKDLVFLAENLPPLGLVLYYVEQIDGNANYHPYENLEEMGSFGDDKFVSFDIAADGRLSKVQMNEQSLNLQQEFYYYHGKTDSNSQTHRASGAYIFRPDGPEILMRTNLTVKYAKGKLCDEVHQIIHQEVTQIIRVYKSADQPFLEFDWLVGNLKVGSNGKNVISRFDIPELKNDDIFYTDSNGRQMMKRQLNKRNDYSYEIADEPVTSNYYPVTSKIVIKDETGDLQLAILNDRSQGGTSLKEGQVELMVHRREVRDDGLGVSESLNEMQFNKGIYARGQHYLMFGKSSNVVNERLLQHQKLLQPVALFASIGNNSLEEIQTSLEFKFELLKNKLPENIKILTLEPQQNGYLLRLEHIFEKAEDEILSQDASIDLKELFNGFEITQLEEVSLGANIKIGAPLTDYKIILKPMEIRSFLFNRVTNKIVNEQQVSANICQQQKSKVNKQFISIILLIISTFVIIL